MQYPTPADRHLWFAPIEYEHLDLFFHIYFFSPFLACIISVQGMRDKQTDRLTGRQGGRERHYKDCNVGIEHSSILG